MSWKASIFICTRFFMSSNELRPIFAITWTSSCFPGNVTSLDIVISSSTKGCGHMTSSELLTLIFGIQSIKWDCINLRKKKYFMLCISNVYIYFYLQKVSSRENKGYEMPSYIMTMCTSWCSIPLSSWNICINLSDIHTYNTRNYNKHMQYNPVTTNNLWSINTTNTHTKRSHWHNNR